MSLQRILHLLNEVSGLAKDEAALGASAREELRLLKVRVRQALQAAASPDPDALPKVAPALFEKRPNKDQGPLEFTLEWYAPWLGKNICRADIRHLDLKLYDAYRNWSVTSADLDAIGLPTKNAVIESKLATAGVLKRPSSRISMSEMSGKKLEEARLWHVQDRRRRRSGKGSLSNNADHGQLKP